MRQAGIIAAACIYSLEHNVERLADDHCNAKSLAGRLANVPGLHVAPVETNIVLIDVAGTGRSGGAIAAALAKDHGVNVSHFGTSTVRAVTHLDVSADDVARAGDAFEAVVRAG
jgi:threonine aldolase